MNKKLKKKKDRQERIRQQRLYKSNQSAYSDTAMKRGRWGLYLIGIIIVVAAALVFTHMR